MPIIRIFELEEVLKLSEKQSKICRNSVLENSMIAQQLENSCMNHFETLRGNVSYIHVSISEA